jgi:hypothetical protein
MESLEASMTRFGFGAVLAAAVLVLPASAKDQAQPQKGKKPRLELRLTPRMAMSPVTVHFTAELVGGDELEDWYCPEIEWEWDDGGRSVQESDCAPFSPETKIDRRYSADHDYPRAGNYQIKVILKHNSQILAASTQRLTVRPGISDPANQPE